MLDIQTFDARAGGNVLYKALAHPLAAEADRRAWPPASAPAPLAVYDPDGVANALWAMHPAMPAPAEVYVHDVAADRPAPRRARRPAADRAAPIGVPARC